MRKIISGIILRKFKIENPCTMRKKEGQRVIDSQIEVKVESKKAQRDDKGTAI